MSGIQQLFTLKPEQIAEIRKELRRELARCLTSLDTKADSWVYGLQMQVADSKMIRVSDRRIRLLSVSPEGVFFGGKKLFVHDLSMAEDTRLPESGSFVELLLPDSELYRLSELAKKTPKNDLQMLMTDDTVGALLQSGMLQQVLPPRMRVYFDQVAKRTHEILEYRPKKPAIRAPRPASSRLVDTDR